jgi:hypothetical protein
MIVAATSSPPALSQDAVPSRSKLNETKITIQNGENRRVDVENFCEMLRPSGRLAADCLSASRPTLMVLC